MFEDDAERRSGQVRLALDVPFIAFTARHAEVGLLGTETRVFQSVASPEALRADTLSTVATNDRLCRLNEFHDID
jgi:hypothetical protein